MSQKINPNTYIHNNSDKILMIANSSKNNNSEAKSKTLETKESESPVDEAVEEHSDLLLTRDPKHITKIMNVLGLQKEFKNKKLALTVDRIDHAKINSLKKYTDISVDKDTVQKELDQAIQIESTIIESEAAELVLSQHKNDRASKEKVINLINEKETEITKNYPDTHDYLTGKYNEDKALGLRLVQLEEIKEICIGIKNLDQITNNGTNISSIQISDIQKLDEMIKNMIIITSQNEQLKLFFNTKLIHYKPYFKNYINNEITRLKELADDKEINLDQLKTLQKQISVVELSEQKSLLSSLDEITTKQKLFKSLSNQITLLENLTNKETIHIESLTTLQSDITTSDISSSQKMNLTNRIKTLENARETELKQIEERRRALEEQQYAHQTKRAPIKWKTLQEAEDEEKSKIKDEKKSAEDRKKDQDYKKHLADKEGILDKIKPTVFHYHKKPSRKANVMINIYNQFNLITFLSPKDQIKNLEKYICSHENDFQGQQFKEQLQKIINFLRAHPNYPKDNFSSSSEAGQQTRRPNLVQHMLESDPITLQELERLTMGEEDEQDVDSKSTESMSTHTADISAVKKYSDETSKQKLEISEMLQKIPTDSKHADLTGLSKLLEDLDRSKEDAALQSIKPALVDLFNKIPRGQKIEGLGVINKLNELNGTLNSILPIKYSNLAQGIITILRTATHLVQNQIKTVDLKVPNKNQKASDEREKEKTLSDIKFYSNQGYKFDEKAALQFAMLLEPYEKIEARDYNVHPILAFAIANPLHDQSSDHLTPKERAKKYFNDKIDLVKKKRGIPPITEKDFEEFTFTQESETRTYGQIRQEYAYLRKERLNIINKYKAELAKLDGSNPNNKVPIRRLHDKIDELEIQHFQTRRDFLLDSGELQFTGNKEIQQDATLISNTIDSFFKTLDKKEQEEIMRATVEDLHQEIRNLNIGDSGLVGTTLNVTIVWHDEKNVAHIRCINAGDSRSFYSILNEEAKEKFKETKRINTDLIDPIKGYESIGLEARPPSTHFYNYDIPLSENQKLLTIVSSDGVFQRIEDKDDEQQTQKEINLINQSLDKSFDGANLNLRKFSLNLAQTGYEGDKDRPGSIDNIAIAPLIGDGIVVVADAHGQKGEKISQYVAKHFSRILQENLRKNKNFIKTQLTQEQTRENFIRTPRTYQEDQNIRRLINQLKETDPELVNLYWTHRKKIEGVSLGTPLITGGVVVGPIAGAATGFGLLTAASFGLAPVTFGASLIPLIAIGIGAAAGFLFSGAYYLYQKYSRIPNDYELAKTQYELVKNKPHYPNLPQGDLQNTQSDSIKLNSNTIVIDKLSKSLEKDQEEHENEAPSASIRPTTTSTENKDETKKNPFPFDLSKGISPARTVTTDLNRYIKSAFENKDMIFINSKSLRDYEPFSKIKNSEAVFTDNIKDEDMKDNEIYIVVSENKENKLTYITYKMKFGPNPEDILTRTQDVAGLEEIFYSKQRMSHQSSTTNFTLTEALNGKNPEKIKPFLQTIVTQEYFQDDKQASTFIKNVLLRDVDKAQLNEEVVINTGKIIGQSDLSDGLKQKLNARILANLDVEYKTLEAEFKTKEEEYKKLSILDKLRKEKPTEPERMTQMLADKDSTSTVNLIPTKEGFQAEINLPTTIQIEKMSDVNVNAPKGTRQDKVTIKASLKIDVLNPRELKDNKGNIFLNCPTISVKDQDISYVKNNPQIKKLIENEPPSQDVVRDSRLTSQTQNR